MTADEKTTGDLPWGGYPYVMTVCASLMAENQPIEFALSCEGPEPFMVFALLQAMESMGLTMDDLFFGQQALELARKRGNCDDGL